MGMGIVPVIYALLIVAGVLAGVELGLSDFKSRPCWAIEAIVVALLLGLLFA